MMRSFPRFLTCGMAVALLAGCVDQLHRPSTEQAEATKVDEASALEISTREHRVITGPNPPRTGVVEPDVYRQELPPIEVLRTARYQLVATRAPLGQRQLLEQYVNVSVPPSVSTTVGDGIEYTLQNTGYSLCSPDANHQRWLFSRPLPATHYRLGPMPLREALQVLAGDAWELEVDPVRREVCYEQRDIRTVETVEVVPSVASAQTATATESDDE